MNPVLRPARPSDAPAVIRFLQEKMNPRWRLEKWARVFDTRWARAASGPPNHGVLIEVEGRVMGFCGVVTADREINGRWERFGSITSLYLDRSLRGRGLGRALMVEASVDPETTFTVIGTGAGSRPQMEPAGYRLLDRARQLWRRSAPHSGPAVRILTEPVVIAKAATAAERRMLDDHAGLRIAPALLEAPEGRALMVFWPQAHAGGPRWDAIHVADGALAARYAQALANALLPPDAPATLAIDQRFLPAGAAGERQDYGEHNFFKSPRLAASQIDLLYTETLLLDLKLS